MTTGNEKADALHRVTEWAAGTRDEVSREDVGVLLASWMELQNAITWGTSCLNCSGLLDANYEMYVKLDKIKELVR